MALYVDDYSILDTAAIIHAVPMDPCVECDDDRHNNTIEYVIHLLLAVGGQGYQVVQTYPTKGLRDAAFEIMCRMVRRDQILEGEVYIP